MTLPLASFLLVALAAGGETEPRLGELLNIGGVNLLPQVGLELDLPDGPQPGIYRQIALNWHDRPLQVGTYPSRAFAKRQEGRVGLSLQIEPDGRLSACTVALPSGVAEFDGHACSHLLTNVSFHPGLDSAGKRFGGKVAAILTYSLGLSVSVPAADGETPAAPAAKPARPIDRISLATLGITRDLRPRPSIGGIAATLAIEADGSVGACTVESPTYIDAVDAGACDRLRRDVRFRPAEKADGTAVASRYTVSLAFDR